MVHAELLDLHATEEVDVGGTAFDFPQVEIDGSLGDDFVVGIEKAGVLVEPADAAALTRPEAKLEESDGNLRGGDGPDDADQGLRPAHFGAHVLAEDDGLKVGCDGVHGQVEGQRSHAATTKAKATRYQPKISIPCDLR